MACFAFPSACGGSVRGLAAWPYYKLIETLFRNTKVNVSSHVIPISLQWIPLNRGYWVADLILLLEFPAGHPHSEPGNERGWLEGEKPERWEEGGEAAEYCHCPVYQFPIWVTLLQEVSLNVIRPSNAYINYTVYSLWLCLCSFWH